MFTVIVFNDIHEYVAAEVISDVIMRPVGDVFVTNGQVTV